VSHPVPCQRRLRTNQQLGFLFAGLIMRLRGWDDFVERRVRLQQYGLCGSEVTVGGPGFTSLEGSCLLFCGLDLGHNKCEQCMRTPPTWVFTPASSTETHKFRPSSWKSSCYVNLPCSQAHLPSLFYVLISLRISSLFEALSTSKVCLRSSFCQAFNSAS
jgi:hypothetical protein